MALMWSLPPFQQVIHEATKQSYEYFLG